MSVLADLLSGGPVGTLIGSLGGLFSGFLKYKTLKESNRFNFQMAQLAGEQEVARAQAELKMVEVEGAIATDIANEQSLQESYKHDSSMGEWLKNRDLGPISTGFMLVAEFVRMLMRPALTLVTTFFVFRMYHDYALRSDGVELDALFVTEQLHLLATTIIVMATMAFSWWFADRSLQKALRGKLGI